MDGKYLCKRGFFGEDSKHLRGLATVSKRSLIAKQSSKGCT